MSLYELTLVLKESADEATAKTLVSGKIKSTKPWGAKDLAYPIKGAKRGGYFYFTVELEPGEIVSLDKTLKQNEQVLRYLLIKAKE